MGWEIIDAHIRKDMEERISKGERPTIICWIRSFFKDDEKAKCDKCGIKVAIRPYMKKLARQYNLSILCVGCGDKEEIKRQLIIEGKEILRETSPMGDKGVGRC